MIKVSILGPEHLHEQLPTTKLDNKVEYEDENINRHENVKILKKHEKESKVLSHSFIRKNTLLLPIPFARHSRICAL